MYTRRDFAKHMATALPLAALLNGRCLWALNPGDAAPAAEDATVIHGVHIGLEGYSLTPLPHDTVLDDTRNLMVEMGVRELSMWDSLMQPAAIFDQVSKAPRAAPGVAMTPEQKAVATAADDALKNWRATVSLDYFRNIRKKFNDAKIDIYTNQAGGLSSTSTDEELQRACDIAKALGAKVITTSMPRAVLKRFAPIAAKNDLKIDISGRPRVASTDPDFISKPADYIDAVSFGDNIGIELDIGDATAGGIDTLEFVKEHHDKFYRLNLKDRKKDRTSMPWGQGETPVKDLLLLIRDNNYPIRCYIDCDYPTAPGGTRTADIKSCLAYIKSVLNS